MRLRVLAVAALAIAAATTTAHASPIVIHAPADAEADEPGVASRVRVAADLGFETGQFGGHTGSILSNAFEAEVRVLGPLWIHARFNRALAGVGATEIAAREGDLGVRTRWTGDRLSAFGGLAVGYLHGRIASDEDDAFRLDVPTHELHDVVVLPNVGLEVALSDGMFARATVEMRLSQRHDDPSSSFAVRAGIGYQF